MNKKQISMGFAALLLSVVSITAYGLSKEQQADMYLMKAQQAYKNKNYAEAISAFETIEQLNVNMGDEFYYFYASALKNAYKIEKASSMVGKYLERTGTAGQYYQDALSLYLSLDASKEVIKNLELPKMVTIPSGRFQMGSNGNNGYEKPVHWVSISAFKMSETEVTFANWDACVESGGCSYRPDDRGWGRGTRPVINVSYDDITQQFIPWLNKVTGSSYRLPSEAEWEYAARAGSTTEYSWGDSISCSQARYANDNGDCGNERKTVPVKSYRANDFGLYDMHGNVWELTEDYHEANYRNGPINNSARKSGDSSLRVIRGGAWDWGPYDLRSARRMSQTASDRSYYLGFRLVQGR